MAGANAFRPQIARLDELGSSLAPSQGTPADVASAEALRPVDQVNRAIGALMCLGERATQRADGEDSPAIGEQASVLPPARAGMEDLHLFDLGCALETLDLGALAV